MPARDFFFQLYKKYEPNMTEIICKNSAGTFKLFLFLLSCGVLVLMLQWNGSRGAEKCPYG